MDRDFFFLDSDFSVFTVSIELITGKPRWSSDNRAADSLSTHYFLGLHSGRVF